MHLLASENFSPINTKSPISFKLGRKQLHTNGLSNENLNVKIG